MVSGMPRKDPKEEVPPGEFISPRMAMRYRKLSRRSILNEDKTRDVIKRHLIMMLGQTGSVKEYLEVVAKLSDMCGWKKAAEVKATTTISKEDEAEGESIQQLRKMLEN